MRRGIEIFFCGGGKVGTPELLCAATQRPGARSQKIHPIARKTRRLATARPAMGYALTRARRNLICCVCRRVEATVEATAAELNYRGEDLRTSATVIAM